MAEQVRIFVSHHHSPAEDIFTERLVRDLKAAGADVWWDVDGISSGSFVAKISEGLAGRQWLVLVMTPDALKSPWVRSEVETAIDEFHAGRMQGVIPIVMSPCAVEDIPLLWRKFQRYDATKDYQHALAGLLRAMSLTMPPPPQDPRLPTAVKRPSRVLRTSSPPSPAVVLSQRASLLPPRLAELGFAAREIGGTQAIVPPVVSVPTGEFLMGSVKRRDAQAHNNELPQHRVALNAYKIGTFLITVAEYACFVCARQLQPQNWQQQLAKPDHPVVHISWYNAVAYAAWLAKLTGQPWRLPTEAEWEKAARGTDGRIYPWGDAWDKNRTNTHDGGPVTTTPVGSYPTGASPYGALDMAGNVWEWTSTLFKPYPYSQSDGREDQNYTENRVMRGGAWNDDPRYCRAANRIDINLDIISLDLGFRVALAAPGS